MATYSLSPNASTFAKRLVDDTGLNGNVVAAWIIAETSGNNTTNGPNNWLNVGSFDSGFAGGGANVWQDPTTGADATAAFMLRHAVNGVNPPLGGADPSGGITDIPGTASQSPQAQVSAIQRSNWSADHYPDLLSVYNGIVAQGGFGLPAGGTSGAGGTGTANTSTGTVPWTVGDASNPDQDYWTAISQYSQNGQLYAFSDAETLYVADGIKLMSQQPAAVIIRTDPSVIRAECTMDNTAFQYVSTHKKRGKALRRATLAKVTSPTEVTVRLVCPIDQVRAGDVVWLKLFGPADGFWLVGDSTRSIFQPYSDLTLVPALQPINAATAAPATSTATTPGTQTSAQAPAATSRPLPSKDYNGGRPASQINTIVLHDSEIANTPGSESDLQSLWNALDGQGLSVHIGINGDGHVWRMVDDLTVAYHASGANGRSLGIEQIGFSTQTSWPDAQIKATASQVGAWCKAYNIPIRFGTTNGVCQHKDLTGADNPDGHTDCGPSYPFDRVLALASGK